MTDEDLAKMMYTDWCGFIGTSDAGLPEWKDLNEYDQERWVYVAGMVREPVINSFKGDLLKEINELEDVIDDHRDTLWKIFHLLKPILNIEVIQ